MRNLFLVGILSAASIMAAPVFTVIPTFGPNPGSSSFSGWVTNTINGLRGIQSPPVGTGAQQYNPMASGATVQAGQLIATESLNFLSWQGTAPGTLPVTGTNTNELGNTLYFSLIVQESTPGLDSFSLGQITVDETYLGVAYGSSALSPGNPYRPAAVGVQGNGTVLNDGVTSENTMVNALYYVGVGFSWQALAGSGTNQDVLNQNIAAIQGLSDRTTQVCYSGNSTSACGNVSVPGADQGIPEPGTWALMGAGLAGLALLRRRA